MEMTKASLLIVGILATGLVAAPASAGVQLPEALPSKAAGKTLVLKAFGLPADAKAKVTVRGPGSYQVTKRFTGSVTLRSLRPGTYKLKARPASVSTGKARVSVRPVRSVTVTKQRGATATFIYVTPDSR